jgi:hypothetical protein
MVDATTLIVLSTIAQTIVITITLVIFILQFRSQEKAMKEASYQGLMGRYNDYIRTLVERPALARLLVARMGDPGEQLTEDEAAVYGHLLIAYGIIEEAYGLYKKGWIDKENWSQWSAFLEAIAQSPEFARIHAGTSGTFDGDFEDYVTKILSRARSVVKEGEK